MSVVVYRDGVMAADSRINIGEVHHVGMDKIARGLDNELIGVVGTISSCQKFIDWYLMSDTDEEYVEPPDVEDMDALVVIDHDKVYGYFDNCVPIRLHGEYFAVGSGAEVALGALAVGATARQAVEAAVKHVSNCGEPVVTKYLDGSD